MDCQVPEPTLWRHSHTVCVSKRLELWNRCGVLHRFQSIQHAARSLWPPEPCLPNKGRSWPSGWQSSPAIQNPLGDAC